MDKYNLTVHFNQAHLKPVFYTDLSSSHFKEELGGLYVFPDLYTSIFFPWSAIHYLRKEKVKEQ